MRRPEFLGITKIGQGIEAAISDEINAATVAAVAAIRSAAGNKFFPPETECAVAAIARDDPNCRLINKFHVLKIKNPAGLPRRGVCALGKLLCDYADGFAPARTFDLKQYFTGGLGK